MKMATLTKDSKTDLLFEQLLKTEGKAEIVDGEIVEFMPTGEEPSLAGLEIVVSLRAFARRTGIGRAVPDNATFRVDLPNRKSFSPDAAYINRPRSGSMGPIEGAPVFAVEVRSENDYGRAAELAISQKIADYFAAGTLVVWDVDLQSADVIKSYRASESRNPTIYRRSEIASAEPAVPGWSLEVDALFA
jgi:Uma2 family endonuclease